VLGGPKGGPALVSAVVAAVPTMTEVCPQPEVVSVMNRVAPMTAIPLQRRELARLMILQRMFVLPFPVLFPGW
jgi:hypothetical protein